MTRRSSGFTLVELMLSMAFLAMLLLAIAYLVLQISSIYNKGLTLKSVNETGQLVTSDIQRTLNTANPLAVRDAKDSPVTGGRVCVGSYVYAWNYGRSLDEANPMNIYASRAETVRLVKFQAVSDVDYCTPVDDNRFEPVPDDAAELIASRGSNLAVHEPFVFIGRQVTGDVSQSIYEISMVLGTDEDSISSPEDGIISGNGCVVPKSTIDDQYCAVNTFKFTARAGNNNEGESE
jgi:type II secretory pathway pseudopilin PulG